MLKMNSREKKRSLESIIENKLLELIDNDFVILDLPYHKNIGDTLIYQGQLDFLQKLPYKCLGKGSHVFNYLPNVSDNTIILVQGGGNFGDLYRDCQEYKNKIVQKYKNNRIIFFPQTMHYENKSNLIKDAEIFNRHGDLFLFLRDKVSLNIGLDFFDKCHVELLPDMAFCISEVRLMDLTKKLGKKPVLGSKNLFFKRLDYEISDSIKYDDFVCRFNNDYDVHDWSTFEKENFRLFILRAFSSVAYRIKSDGFIKTILNSFAGFYYDNFVRGYMLENSIAFIESYDNVLTTRLHGCILSVLLDKKIYLLDNSYGKNSTFFDCWLYDLDSIELLTRSKE